MIISHKYKLIFIHVYKNAGMFIGRLLMKMDKKAIKYPKAHISARIAKKVIHPKIWDNYTKFCVIRNSWDWQISLLYYMKGEPKHHQHKIVRNMNIHKYLLWRKNNDLHQQKDFILDKNGKCLVDKIILYDNFKENLSNFFKEHNKININPFLPKRRINKSKRNKDYKVYYNEEDRDLLAEMHRPDIDYFDFTF